MTSRIERISADITPAPLPPSPAADAADVWFEQVPTNPAAVPDLEALAGRGSRPDLRSSSLARARKTPEEGVVTSGETWSDYSGPQLAASTSQSWLLQVLIAATCLAVGMVLGALLFGGTGKSSSSPPDAGACDCSKCPQITSEP